MNNLKFRAYFEQYERMIDNIGIINQNMILVDFTNSEELEPIFITDKIHVMQSTGFKDKNGKEIFDGDIVNCGYLFNGSPFDELDEYEEEKGVVKLSNCDCAFSIKFKNDTYLFIDVIKSCEDIEVIGNIYENEELLENDFKKV